eukprot:4093828-Pyramimonas_sp.AAC.2
MTTFMTVYDSLCSWTFRRADGEGGGGARHLQVACAAPLGGAQGHHRHTRQLGRPAGARPHWPLQLCHAPALQMRETSLPVTITSHTCTADAGDLAARYTYARVANTLGGKTIRVSYDVFVFYYVFVLANLAIMSRTRRSAPSADSR